MVQKTHWIEIRPTVLPPELKNTLEWHFLCWLFLVKNTCDRTRFNILRFLRIRDEKILSIYLLPTLKTNKTTPSYLLLHWVILMKSVCCKRVWITNKNSEFRTRCDFCLVNSQRRVISTPSAMLWLKPFGERPPSCASTTKSQLITADRNWH